MKINTEFLDDHQVKIKVDVEPASFEDAKKRAARRIAKKTKIPGFRPGKAPYSVIVSHVGEPAIFEEAMEILVDEFYPKAIQEAEISPYGPGTLENLSVDPPSLDFLIPLSPTVELGDYQNVRVPYDYEGVSEEDIERYISDLRERQVILEPVERPAEEDDQVFIKLSANRLNPEEGKDPVFIKERDAAIVIKPDEVDETEYPYSGFSRALVGLSVGDEKTVQYNYPENDRYVELSGVEAEFYITVKEIKSRTLPELDDEFAQSIGEFSTFDELKAAVIESLEQQAQETFHQEYDDKVLTELVDISTIKYPPQMLEREIDRSIDSLNARLSQQRMDIDLYLKTRNIDMAGLREEIKPNAEAGLKKSLIVMEISDKEKIQVDQEELKEETTKTMNAYAQYMPEKEIRKFESNQEAVSNLIGHVMFDLMTHKTILKIRSIASGKEEQIAEEIEAEGNDVNDTVEEETTVIENNTAETDVTTESSDTAADS